MATFFVGQRVRCVKTLGGGCLGREGRVLEVDASGVTKSPARMVFYGNGLLVDHGYPTLGPPECWEPILPDGHRACDEDFKRDLDRLLEREGVQA